MYHRSAKGYDISVNWEAGLDGKGAGETDYIRPTKYELPDPLFQVFVFLLWLCSVPSTTNIDISAGFCGFHVRKD